MTNSTQNTPAPAQKRQIRHVKASSPEPINRPAPGLSPVTFYIDSSLLGKIRETLRGSTTFDSGSAFVESLFDKEHIDSILQRIASFESDAKGLLEKFAAERGIKLRK